MTAGRNVLERKAVVFALVNRLGRRVHRFVTAALKNPKTMIPPEINDQNENQHYILKFVYQRQRPNKKFWKYSQKWRTEKHKKIYAEAK